MHDTSNSEEITPNKHASMSDKSLKMIKLASIIMGILIILGVIALVFGLQQKLSYTNDPFSEYSIYLSEGQKIISVSSDGEGGVLLWIENTSIADGEQLIQQFDKSGNLRRQYKITSK